MRVMGEETSGLMAETGMPKGGDIKGNVTMPGGGITIGGRTGVTPKQEHLFY